MSRRLPILPALLALFVLVAIQGRSMADYIDPWGLPSGSATLPLLTQTEIASSNDVQGFDFAAGAVIDTTNYSELVLEGVVDLLFVELVPGESQHFLRAPEDQDYFDRSLIYRFEDGRTIDQIAGTRDEDGLSVPWERFGAVEADFTYVLLQIQTGASPETTAVKLGVTAVDGESVSFDWVWQPNGSDAFIPSPVTTSTLSTVKALYR